MVPQRQLLTPVDYFIPLSRRFYTGGDRAGQPRDKVFSSVSAVFTGANAVGPLQSITVGIAIDSSFDFLAFAINAVCTLTDNVTAIAFIPATILLQTTGGGSRIMDQPQHIETLRGSNGLPGSTPWPIWLPGSGTVNVTITSMDPTNTLDFFVTLPGVAIY
jgi:hypothetical protein